MLRGHGVEPPQSVSPLRGRALACPALPTCGLSLAESERVVPAILAAVQAELDAAGLADEPITLRMTGCPNGCARPYVAEIGIVGQSADRYQLYLGGSAGSTRLATVWREGVRSAEIGPLLGPLFAAFAARRRAGEGFGDWCARDVRGRGSGVSTGRWRRPRARAERVVREALARYPGRVALACSFGGPSGMVLLDLALRVDPRRCRSTTSTPGCSSRETHALVERAARRYGIAPLAVVPELSLDGAGRALRRRRCWARDPDRCCALRKVAPHQAFLRGYDAWLTGIRRAQSSTAPTSSRSSGDERTRRRQGEPAVRLERRGRVGRTWTGTTCRSNALHADGYPSIGCRAVHAPPGGGRGRPRRALGRLRQDGVRTAPRAQRGARLRWTCV